MRRSVFYIACKLEHIYYYYYDFIARSCLIIYYYSRFEIELHAPTYTDYGVSTVLNHKLREDIEINTFTFIAGQCKDLCIKTKQYDTIIICGNCAVMKRF